MRRSVFASSSATITRMAPVHPHLVLLRGGLDMISPTLSLPLGICSDALNFEVEPTGGYTRIEGYERLDGHASPSSASYAIAQVDSLVHIPVAGNTLTGFTSGATGQVIALSAASNYVVLTLITGSFTTGEVVKVGALVIGTLVQQTVTISSLLNAQYLALAADVYRLLIAAVPGSGAIRGVVSATFSGIHTVYAFRDNAGGTASALYKSSASGWTLVPFFREISFDTAAAAIPADGATLSKGGVTATVKRVMLQTGAWTGAGTGRFIIDTPAGGEFSAGAATLTGGATCNLLGASTAITMAPGGKFSFDIGNFAGRAVTRRIYGADGANRCFEFDGTILAPIVTGFSPDTPLYAVIHKNYLFVAIGSSIANSAIGAPFDWTANHGASEIAVGDTVTNMKVMPGDQSTPSMLVTTLQALNILYGTAATGTNPFNLVNYNTGTGAAAYSVQNMNDSYMLDNRGVIDLQTSLNFGNFTHSTLTLKVAPYLQSKRSKMVYSSLSKDRAQYRLFFNDGSGLYLTIVNGKFMGAMPTQFTHIVSCAWQTENAVGDAVSYFGDTNGFVHQMGKGSSFDGQEINAYVLLHWDAIKTPRMLKRYRRASIEIQGNFYAAVTYGYQLGYGSTDIDQPAAILYPSNFSGPAQWDNMSWDNFTWDGSTLAPTEVNMEGTAVNFKSSFHSATNYLYPFTLNSLLVHYSDRRQIR